MLLSISDLCVGLNIMVSLALIRLAPADWETEMFVAISVTAYLFVMFSFCMIIIISLDRYIHMKYLMKYSVIMTPKRVKIMVAFAALTSISLDALVASGRIFGFPFAVQLTTNIMIVLGMVALFIIYTKAYKELAHVNGQSHKKYQPFRISYYNHMTRLKTEDRKFYKKN